MLQDGHYYFFFSVGKAKYTVPNVNHDIYLLVDFTVNIDTVVFIFNDMQNNKQIISRIMKASLEASVTFTWSLY